VGDGTSRSKCLHSMLIRSHVDIIQSSATAPIPKHTVVMRELDRVLLVVRLSAAHARWRRIADLPFHRKPSRPFSPRRCPILPVVTYPSVTKGGVQPKCIPVDNHGVVEEMAPLGCQIRHAVLRAYVRGISSAGPAGLDVTANPPDSASKTANLVFSKIQVVL